MVVVSRTPFLFLWLLLFVGTSPALGRKQRPDNAQSRRRKAKIEKKKAAAAAVASTAATFGNHALSASSTGASERFQNIEQTSAVLQRSMLWATPITVLNLSAAVDMSANEEAAAKEDHYRRETTITGRSMAVNLARAAASAFDKLCSNYTHLRELLAISMGDNGDVELSPEQLNQAFYIWQQQSKRHLNLYSSPSTTQDPRLGVPSFWSMPEFRALTAHFESAARQYLVATVGESAAEGSVYPVKQGTTDVHPGFADCWASAHRAGSWHPPHHHLTSSEIVSGVFYSSVPKAGDRTDNPTDHRKGMQGGALVFSDPRGALPPFGHSFRVTPVEGNLVLFPSSLVHAVEPCAWTNQGAPSATLSTCSNEAGGMHEEKRPKEDAERFVAVEIDGPTSRNGAAALSETAKKNTSEFPTATTARRLRISFSCNYHSKRHGSRNNQGASALSSFGLAL